MADDDSIYSAEDNKNRQEIGLEEAIAALPLRFNADLKTISRQSDRALTEPYRIMIAQVLEQYPDAALSDKLHEIDLRWNGYTKEIEYSGHRDEVRGKVDRLIKEYAAPLTQNQISMIVKEILEDSAARVSFDVLAEQLPEAAGMGQYPELYDPATTLRRALNEDYLFPDIDYSPKPARPMASGQKPSGPTEG